MQLQEWIDKWRPRVKIKDRETLSDGRSLFVYELTIEDTLYPRGIAGAHRFEKGKDFDMRQVLIDLAWDLSMYWPDMEIKQFREQQDHDPNKISYAKMQHYLSLLEIAFGKQALDDLSEVGL